MRLTVFFTALLLLLGVNACDFTYKLKSGQEAYDVKRYAIAVEMLQNEYAETQDPKSRANKAFLLGESYSRMGKSDAALGWYRQAVDDNYGIPALEKYAETCKQLERYDEAIEIYQQLMASQEQSLRYRQQLVACQQAAQWLEQSGASVYEVEMTGFNSAGSDYAPYVLGPEMLIFTSDRTVSTNDPVYEWTGRSFSDLYVANTQLNTVQPFDPTINSEHNEGTITFSQDKSEVYFSRCFDDGSYDMYCKLMMCVKRGASWTTPEALPFVVEGVNYMHPVLTRNDSLLVFASNDPGGMGGYDLYYSVRGETGWETPRPLSERINTPGNEQFPSFHKDTLYFSSDYHPGMGGLDIFKTYLPENGDWTPPYNLKPPVNSGWDDFGFVVDTFAQLRGNVLQRGFFASSRESGDGGDDIYAFAKIIPEPESETEVVVENEEPEEKINYQVFLAIRVMEPIFEDPDDPNSPRVGKRPLSRARVNVGQGVEMRSLRTDEHGFMVLELDFEQEYDLQARFRGFLTEKSKFSTVDLEKDPAEPVKTYNLEFVLEPIFAGKEIILENIYYDLNEWVIRDDARPALDQLAKILQDNPGIRIELGSHTDCRADDDYNLDLSQKRAQSAVDYLIQRGIDEERLNAVGYGETQFAVDCACEECSEEEHQDNRRTTFKIVR